ncbi:MAG: hypothetical protein JXA38_02360 [Methanosarcinaceae archaeon]|nr:hypothetical protein [Methanosarcinaceae archaeon]
MFRQGLTAFLVLLMFFLIPLASAQDIHIVDTFSDIDSADVTIHSGGHYSGVTIDAELIFGGKVLVSRHFDIKETFPDTDTTKVMYWEIAKPEVGLYRTKMTLSMNGSAQETKYYNFSYGRQALPRIFIKDIVPDSSGLSVILAPYSTQWGTEPVLADVDYMLVDGDTVIYHLDDKRITVVQATPLSRNWNVRLENNHDYSARVKAAISAPRVEMIAQSRNFTAMDDAEITELYRDETGASATILGLSQVPFSGNVIFTVTENGETIEDIREKSPILMSEDDETIEVIWSERLQPGIYELSVTVVGNDGDDLDRWDSIIEAKANVSQNVVPTPTPAGGIPGFNIFTAISVLMLVYMISRRGNLRNR